MRALTSRHLLACLFFLFIFSSCKKDVSKIKSIPVNALAGIPAFPLNWETADYMPTPPNSPTILVPWASGSVKGFSSDIWYDYHPVDGWELVYNTFNTTSLPNNPFFVLYNRYRGLIRYYAYITTSGFTTSSYLTTGLNLAPNIENSPMLNYVGQDIVNVNIKPASVVQIEPTQIATGTWYAAQYEIAYDPGTAGYTFAQLGLNWTLKWTNITQVNLGGSIVGTLKGTITTEGTGFNISGTQVTKGALSAVGLAAFNSAGGPDNTKPEIGNAMGLAAGLFKAFKDGLTGGVIGFAKNILNGIIGAGGTAPTIQSLNATFNASITLTGSLTDNGAIFPDPGLGLLIPGVSNSQQGAGYIPAYDLPLGVFSVPQMPVVNVHAVNLTGSRPSSRHTYSMVPFTIDINPAVTQVAQVVVEKQEVVVLANGVAQTDGVPEVTNASYPTYTNPTYVIFRDWIFPPNYHPYIRIAVRVIVKVTPNNPATAPFKIVKTFLANEVRI
jgi:hypothetical protein